MQKAVARSRLPSGTDDCFPAVTRTDSRTVRAESDVVANFLILRSGVNMRKISKAVSRGLLLIPLLALPALAPAADVVTDWKIGRAHV